MKDYILGVDLGGTNIKAAAYRLGSYEKVGEKRLPTQVEGGWEHVLGRVLAALEELLRQTPRERVLCVGMGVPGLLDIEAGVSRFSPNFPQWEDVPVAAWLEERLLGPARRVVESHALAISRAGRNRHRPAGGRRRDAGGRRLRRPPHGGGRPDVSRKKSSPF